MVLGVKQGGLNVGDQAPDFELLDQAGQKVSLSERYRQQWVVLFFYPKDHTPGCTAQACSFRDAYEDFKAVGAEVIGISSDDQASHQNFAQTHRLPFVLLSDDSGQVRKAYGVPKTLGLLPGRVTFVIDPQGVIQMVYNSQFNAESHIEKALELLKIKAS